MASVDLRVVGLAAGRWPNWVGFSENRGLDEGVDDAGEPEDTVGGVLPHAANSIATTTRW
jgi:hypothetical protein